MGDRAMLEIGGGPTFDARENVDHRLKGPCPGERPWTLIPRGALLELGNPLLSFIFISELGLFLTDLWATPGSMQRTRVKHEEYNREKDNRIHRCMMAGTGGFQCVMSSHFSQPRPLTCASSSMVNCLPVVK